MKRNKRIIGKLGEKNQKENSNQQTIIWKYD